MYTLRSRGLPYRLRPVVLLRVFHSACFFTYTDIRYTRIHYAHTLTDMQPYVHRQAHTCAHALTLHTHTCIATQYTHMHGRSHVYSHILRLLTHKFTHDAYEYNIDSTCTRALAHIHADTYTGYMRAHNAVTLHIRGRYLHMHALHTLLHNVHTQHTCAKTHTHTTYTTCTTGTLTLHMR
jgi:hypothetical protein